VANYARIPIPPDLQIGSLHQASQPPPFSFREFRKRASVLAWSQASYPLRCAGYAWGKVGDVIIRKTPKGPRIPGLTIADRKGWIVLENVTGEVGAVTVSPWENRSIEACTKVVERSDTIL
jgi:hypothetical protein